MNVDRGYVAVALTALFFSGCGAGSLGTSGTDGAGAGGGTGHGGSATVTSATGGGSPGAGGAGGGGGGNGVVDPGTDGDGDRDIGPDYTDAPEVADLDGVPKGTIVSFKMSSAESTIYPGNAPKTGAYTRQVWVYVPKQYVKGTPAPVMVVQDGGNYIDVLSRSLNNLIAAKKLPVMVAVFADSGGGDYLQSERGIEYDTLSGTYAQWADTELLPRAELETQKQLSDQAVTFSHDPEARGAMGGSSGGNASFTMLWYRPDLFRRAVTFSGTFVIQEWPVNPEHPLGGWNYHDDQDIDDGGLIAKEATKKPIRAWLESGTNDLGSGDPASTHRNFDLANQRMAVKLAAKGYHYHYDHAANANHVDNRVVKQTLPEALLWTWRGFPIQ
jgi:iron(III)-enterobactin esterase